VFIKGIAPWLDFSRKRKWPFYALLISFKFLEMRITASDYYSQTCMHASKQQQHLFGMFMLNIWHLHKWIRKRKKLNKDMKCDDEVGTLAERCMISDTIGS
jgi:hypothetical protein